MTPEQERWAEATTILRRHGDQAPVYIAERIAALAATGDQAGVDRWKEIAARLDRLLEGTLQ